MRLWLTPATAVSLRDQISRQISLAILSGELQPGEKLPSLRALSRRFRLHPNTVSSAYRRLQDEGLVRYCRGSGIYLRSEVPGRDEQLKSSFGTSVASHIAETVHAARQLGMTDHELLEQIKAFLDGPSLPVLVEEDRDLIELVLFEIESAGRCKPDVYVLKDGCNASRLKAELDGRLAAVMPSKAQAVLAAVGDASQVVVLQINAVAASFAEHLPRSRDHLVAVASHWPRSLQAHSIPFLGSAM